MCKDFPIRPTDSYCKAPTITGGASADGWFDCKFIWERRMNVFINLRERLANWLSGFSPSCKTAARLQSEMLDHKLTWRQRQGLRIHLALCKWCRRYGK